MPESIPFLYINQTGTILPDTSGILTDVTNEYLAVFGADLVVSPSSPQGVLITAEALARTEVVQNNAQIANQINPNIAGGTFLDAIMSLTGIQRTAQTQTQVPNVTVAGVAGTIIAAISHTAVISSHTAQAAGNTSGNVGPYITLQSGDGASCSIGQVIRILNNTPSGVQFQLRYIVAISSDTVTVNRDWGTVPSSSTTYSVFNGFLLEVSPNQVTEIIRVFDNCAADVSGGSTRTFYAKIFAVNNNTTTALTTAQIIKEIDPSGLYAASGALNIALTNSLNDTATTANRQTGPGSGITAYTSGAAPQAINVPSPQNLPSGSAPNTAGSVGVWLQLVLPAGIAAAKGSVTMRATGTTT
jgi:hypothetical protein